MAAAPLLRRWPEAVADEVLTTANAPDLTVLANIVTVDVSDTAAAPMQTRVAATDAELALVIATAPRLTPKE
jgi:hypothetical protein